MNLEKEAKRLAEQMVTTEIFEDEATGKTVYAVCLEDLDGLNIIMTDLCENEAHLIDCQLNIQWKLAAALEQLLRNVKSTDDFTCPIAEKLIEGLDGAKPKRLDRSPFALMEDILEEDEIELVLAWRKQKTRSYKNGRAAGRAKLGEQR